MEVEEVEGMEEVDDGLAKDGDIDIEHHNDLLDIIHGLGLVEDARTDVLVLEEVDGVVSIQDPDQMIAGLQMIAMVVGIKCS